MTKSTKTETLSERLRPMTYAQIDAMSDDEIRTLMGAGPDETDDIATWREAAKAATDEFAHRIEDDVAAGRVRVVTDPAELQRRLGGRPSLSGAGPSVQVRVRITPDMRGALEQIAAAEGRRLSDVSRTALEEYVSRHSA
jgi:hypothetical protein